MKTIVLIDLVIATAACVFILLALLFSETIIIKAKARSIRALLSEDSQRYENFYRTVLLLLFIKDLYLVWAAMQRVGMTDPFASNILGYSSIFYHGLTLGVAYLIFRQSFKP